MHTNLRQMQLMFNGGLAKIVYEEAESGGWSGLGKEVRQICQSLGLPNIKKHNVSKSDVKKPSKRTIIKTCYASLKLLENYKT